ncbi:MAG: hypothetical protein M3Z92_07345 [Bacteroidota bacterium]|nr:hypothetical protein [Bacteroidota bacterium]MDQ6904522.1 hypothetical protein [Bacteroidota bacterium]
MNQSVVIQYKNLLQKVGDIIEVSGYRHDYIAKKMGISPQNFSAKKNRSSWTPDELEKLLGIVDNEEVENYLMLETMRSLKNEETISFEELKKEMGWK